MFLNVFNFNLNILKFFCFTTQQKQTTSLNKQTHAGTHTAASCL